MRVYIVKNMSQDDRVKFSSFAETTKVFLVPEHAIKQYKEWCGEKTAFGFNDFAINLSPGIKTFYMGGDEGAELLVLETEDSNEGRE